MQRPRTTSPRQGILALGVIANLAVWGSACAGGDVTGIAASEVAVSGGGVTVDVLPTNAWQGGFNGAVRITNTGAASITSFAVSFSLGGGATVSGPAWNGDISTADATGARTATQPSWLASSPITTGQSWDVGFPGSGTFSSSTVLSLQINGQAIALGGGSGGGGGGDTTAPSIALSASSTSITAAGTLTLTATAADNVGVARVEFRDGATLLTTDASPPFSLAIAMTSASNGAHTYTARAVDAAGNATTSGAVTVTVNIATGGGGGGTGYTVAGGKLFKDGSEIKIFGLNWFGLETSNHVLHGLWTGRGLASFLADFKSKGFTALRLPVSPETINSGFAITGGPGNGDDAAPLAGKDGRAALEYTLAKTQAAGMLVLVDFHTCNPAQLGAGLPDGPLGCSGYSQAKWLADLKTLATLSLTFTNMIGIDLDNEPHGLTWASWSSLASQGGQAVLSVNPNLTIWVEGVGNASQSGGLAADWGQNLFEAVAIPGIPANRLVFSPHSYGPSVAAQSYFSDPSYPANMPGVWDTLFGHLVGQGFTVVSGEFGGHYTTSATPAQNDKLWQDSYVSYLLAKGTRNNFYWAVNPNSGDTGGVLLDDWLTWDAGKLALLQRLMQ
jgi:endoglucanase